jgi:hypothetical protein
MSLLARPDPHRVPVVGIRARHGHVDAEVPVFDRIQVEERAAGAPGVDHCPTNGKIDPSEILHRGVLNRSSVDLRRSLAI